MQQRRQTQLLCQSLLETGGAGPALSAQSGQSGLGLLILLRQKSVDALIPGQTLQRLRDRTALRKRHAAVRTPPRQALHERLSARWWTAGSTLRHQRRI